MMDLEYIDSMLSSNNEKFLEEHFDEIIIKLSNHLEYNILEENYKDLDQSTVQNILKYKAIHLNIIENMLKYKFTLDILMSSSKSSHVYFRDVKASKHLDVIPKHCEDLKLTCLSNFDSKLDHYKALVEYKEYSNLADLFLNNSIDLKSNNIKSII